MRLLSIKLQNFASYKDLEFNYENQGLALISGPTGSGKSTLQDAALWTLFGVTAKDGNADDVKSWTADGAPTTGVLKLVTKDNKEITVCRIRGSSTQNDLFWIEDYDEPHRGKDITETQALLNQRLGIDPDTYIASAYYNEFSPTGQFFTSKAKDRRELLEKLADLTLPTTLLERITIEKRESKKAIAEATKTVERLTGKQEQLRREQESLKRDVESWEIAQKQTLEALKAAYKTFDREKQSKIDALQTKSDAWEAQKTKQINELANKLHEFSIKLDANSEAICNKCKQPDPKVTKLLMQEDRAKQEISQLDRSVNPFTAQIETTTQLENLYSVQMEGAKSQQNPFLYSVNRNTQEREDTTHLLSEAKTRLEVTEHRHGSLEHLADLSSELRAELLRNTIRRIQDETNRYLTTYFDAELKVLLEVKDTDSLEVTVSKSGYECNYKQLSKGQRGLLKLCFSISVMEASSNRSGVHFSTLFFDEALDGLDVDLKVKTFNLFSELSLKHESILVIEHSTELKNLFSTNYSVKLENDRSVLE